MSYIIRNCKSIDLFTDCLTLDQVAQLLKFNNEDLDYMKSFTNQLFDQGIINWKITEQSDIVRRTQKNQGIDPKVVLGDMVNLIIELDQIV